MRLGMLAGMAAIAVSLAACDEVTTYRTVSDNLDRNVLVVNQTGQTIWSIYGSRATTNSWEEDILGPNTLPSGRSVRINFDDGTGACEFDFRFVFQNGQSIEHYGINVCSIATYTVR